MLRTITISEATFNLLEREAKRTHLSINLLAERLLAERLLETQQEWRSQFDDLLARVHSQMASFDPAEIERDITKASAQVKAARRARRHPR